MKYYEKHWFLKYLGCKAAIEPKEINQDYRMLIMCAWHFFFVNEGDSENICSYGCLCKWRNGDLKKKCEGLIFFANDPAYH